MRSHKRVSALATSLAIVVTPGLLRAQQADRFAAVAPRMQEFVDKGEAAGEHLLTVDYTTSTGNDVEWMVFF